MTFVPDDFEPPLRLETPEFTLEPLAPEHNVADYAAWTSSMEHIRATPGFPYGDWPHEMTLEENERDLERHAADFTARAGFTYTVREPGDGRVVGCLYIYPTREGDGVKVRSWVAAARADLDAPLRETVRAWLREAWPFERVDYPG